MRSVCGGERTSARGSAVTIRRPRLLREFGVVVAGAMTLAAAMHWPLVLGLRRVVPRDLADSPFKAWELAWIGHALRHRPFDLFQANAFWPLPNSLAFSDAMIGYAPAAVVGDGAGAALLRYNSLYLFAYALAFAGAYVLARELGVSPGGALVAGAAFAYAPWRIGQAGHLHVLSSGGIPLALSLLLNGYRRGGSWIVLTGWIVATWQLTLGFTLGLQLAYLLAALAVVALVVWRRTGRPTLRRNLLLATSLGAVIFVVVGALQARPYLQVAKDHPEAQRSRFEVATLSAVPTSFLAAPADSVVWGAATSPFRSQLRMPNEQSLFPGLTIVLFAAAGFWAPLLARWKRVGLAATAAVAASLCFGLHEVLGDLGYLLPYSFLYEWAPGWQGVRTPGRLMTLLSLSLAILAAFGCHRVSAALKPRARSAVTDLLARAIPLVAVAAIVIEGASSLPYPEVERPPAEQRNLASPQLHLPFDNHSLYMFWSTEGFPLILNGYAGFELRTLPALRRRVLAFPDSESVAYLRAAGVRTVVLHPNLAQGTPWAGAERRGIDRLGVSRRPAGNIVVFGLGGGTPK